MSFKLEEINDFELKEEAEEFETLFEEAERRETQNLNKLQDYPSELDEKMKEIIKEFETIQLKKTKKQKYTQMFRTVALVILCITVGFGAITMSVDAFRIKLFDFLIEDHGEYIDLKIIGKEEITKEERAMFPEDWDNVFYPMALPEGYELVHARVLVSGAKYMYFENGDVALKLDYRLISEDTSLVDSENAEIGEAVVNGKEAIYVIKENNIFLRWVTSGYEFTLLTSDINLEQTLKIAESIAFIEL